MTEVENIENIEKLNVECTLDFNNGVILQIYTPINDTIYGNIITNGVSTNRVLVPHDLIFIISRYINNFDISQFNN